MASIRPQDLVFTLFGEYLLHRRGPIPVRSLIRLLAPFGLSEGAVRTVLSRMAAKRWLSSSPRGHYGLTARGRKLLEAGEAKILHARWDADWDGQWFLLAYSIPEESRRVRDRLRDRLAWLGFGSLGNGLWISPHDVTGEVNELAAELKLGSRLVCFRGAGVGETDPERLVSACWDLAGINRRYERFIARWAKRFTTYRDAVPAGRASLERCYVLRFRLIHEYREFPLLDPYLPRALLPADWGGECAAHLFRVFHEMLLEPADRWVDSVVRAPRRGGVGGRRPAGAVPSRD